MSRSEFLFGCDHPGPVRPEIYTVVKWQDGGWAYILAARPQ